MTAAPTDIDSVIARVRQRVETTPPDLDSLIARVRSRVEGSPAPTPDYEFNQYTDNAGYGDQRAELAARLEATTIPRSQWRTTPHTPPPPTLKPDDPDAPLVPGALRSQRDLAMLNFRHAQAGQPSPESIAAEEAGALGRIGAVALTSWNTAIEEAKRVLVPIATGSPYRPELGPMGTESEVAAQRQESEAVAGIAGEAGAIEQTIGSLAALPPSMLDPKVLAAMILTKAPAGAVLGSGYYNATLGAVGRVLGRGVQEATGKVLAGSVHGGTFGGVHGAISGGTPGEIAAEAATTAGLGAAFGAAGAGMARLGKPREAIQPLPEAPETIRAQMDALAKGKKDAVLLTPGEPPPELPPNTVATQTAAGVVVHDPMKVSQEKVQAAAESDKLGGVLGYGIDAKPAPEATIGAVVVRTPEGIEKQAVLTDRASLSTVRVAAEKVAGPGDTIALEDPAKVIAGRLEALTGMTFKELQAEARKLGLPAGGKRSELIPRIQEKESAGASEIGQAKEVHADVRTQSRQGQEEVPAQESGAGVQQVIDGVRERVSAAEVGTGPDMAAHRASLMEKAGAYDERMGRVGVTWADVTPEGYGPKVTNAGIEAPNQIGVGTVEVERLKSSINEAKTLLRGKMPEGKRKAVKKQLAGMEEKLRESSPPSLSAEDIENQRTARSRGGFVPLPEKETQVKVKGAVDTLRAITAPITARLGDEPAVTAMTTMAATPTVAHAEALKIDARLRLTRNSPTDIKAGAVFLEDRLRGVKDRETAAANAATDPAEKQAHLDNADAVRTLIGDYFPDEAAYQAAKATPEIQRLITGVGTEFVPLNEGLYKRSQELDPQAQLAGKGQDIPHHVSMYAVREGEKVAAGARTMGVPQPESQAGQRLKEKKSAMGRRATGSAPLGYHLSLSEMMQHSLEQNMRSAHLKLMYDALESSGVARRGSVGTAPKEIAGLPTANLRIKDGTLVLVKEGEEATIVPQTQVLTVPRVLVKEIEAASGAVPRSGISELADKIADKMVGLNLAIGIADSVSHNTNLLSRLLNAPGVGANVVERIAGHVGPARLLTALHSVSDKWRLFSSRDPATLQQVSELARLGAIRGIPAEWGYNPVGWIGKGFIERADLATRLALDDAYRFLSDLGLEKKSDEARRRFVLQVGQYNRGLQSEFVRKIKESRVGPFATAGLTFNREAVKTLIGQYGGIAQSLPASAALRFMALGPWAGTIATAAVLNRLMWDDAAPKGIPPGSVKTGEENGKPTYWDPMALFGIRRGLRALGLQETARQIQDGGKPEWSAREAINQWLSPVLGPPVRAASVVATGHEPYLGPGMEPRRVAEVAPPGENWSTRQLGENLKAAAFSTVGQMAPAGEQVGTSDKIRAVAESTFRQYLNQRGRESTPASEAKSERIRTFAQLNQYIDDQAQRIKRIRGSSPEDTRAKREAAMAKAQAEIENPTARARFRREVLKKRVLHVEGAASKVKPIP